MRILVLGGDGMLGHRLHMHLRERHESKVTLRLPLAAHGASGLFDSGNAYDGVDARAFETVERVVLDFSPEVVLNAIGIVKQRADARQAVPSIEVNALFPHRLARLCEREHLRLIHFSTDCVFSGREGHYTENDSADANDLYGRSKCLGEVTQPPALTLRKALIGRELSRSAGLLEWFLAQRGPINGFRRAVFSGFTTIEMARIVEMLIVKHPAAAGLYHVSSEPISKYDLLCLIRDKLGLDTEIRPDDDFHCDRSLDSTHFRSHFAYQPPTWESMIDELAVSA